MPPVYLYKYMSFLAEKEAEQDRKDAILSDNNLWFACPKKFNDPMDCRPHFTFDSDDETARQQFRRKTFANSCNMSCHKSGTTEWMAHFVSLQEKYPSIDDAFIEFAQTVAQDYVRDIGILCLSEAPNDPVMFYHYGDKHKGLCLKFKVDDFLADASQVLYSDNYPVIDFFADDNHEAEYDSIFLTKYRGWEYEKEWRVVDTQGTARLIPYPKELLEGVIFGYDMETKERERVKELLAQRGHTVQLFEAKISARSFFLDIIHCGEVAQP